VEATLGSLAERFDCEFRGDPDTVVDHVDSLSGAGSRALSFLSSAAFKPQLASTTAGIVIVRPVDADDSPVPVLIAKDPYAAYARAAALLHPEPPVVAGIHPAAVVETGADVDPSAEVAAGAFVAAGSRVGARCIVGPGAYVGPDCRLGDDVRLHANTTLVRATTIGDRSIIHAGAVVGADGFGNAMTPAGWVKVPQVGGVDIGADVEIGANTTIDCGAIGDTVIADGVRIDNLCMIAHNVKVGPHTAMAAQCGIAGSATIGARCMFAGQSGSVGHVTICDDVVVTGKTMVSKNITEPGVYSAGWTAEPTRTWARLVARVRRLDVLIERVARLEKDKG